MKKITILLFVIISSLFSSCLYYKDIVNFQDGEHLTTGVKDSISNFEQVRIQTDDVLLINVYSFNKEEAIRFNLVDLTRPSGQAGTSGSTLVEPFGYRVDHKGEIDMPVIGKTEVAGLNIEEVRDIVQKKIVATGYLQDVSVQVRFLSFKITILGEVNAPGSYTIANPKITILEALGLSRDATIFANRDNILIVREENGERKYGRVNLKTINMFNSPYYYLQPNDIVYVQPHRSKILAAPDPASRYITAVLGIATLVTLAVTLAK